jgi:hypothetical protein
LNRLWSAALVSISVAWTAPASATTVVIVRPSNAASEVAETLTRLHGELLSVGVDVPMVDRPDPRNSAGTDWRSWLDEVVGKRGAAAVVDIIGDDQVVAVDVWIVKPQGHFEVTRVTADANAPNRSGTLAIRAFEALRASLLELDLRARGRREEGTKPVPVVAARPEPASTAAAPSGRFPLELGATALISLDGVGPVLMPAVGVGWAPRSSLVVELMAAGAGTRPSVTTAIGSTRVRQEYATFGARYAFHPCAAWWPFVGVAAGTLHTSLDGRASPTVDGHDVDQWSFVVDAGLGAGLRLSPRYFVTLAAQVQVAAPYAAIHFVDTLVATSGRPNLLFTATVGAWL